jgi:peptide deformylase
VRQKERSFHMAIQTILKMGDPRLLRVSRPVTVFGSSDLHALVADMQDSMRAAKWCRHCGAADWRRPAGGDFWLQ